MDQAHPAPDPANGAGQIDSVAAQHVRCGRQACCTLGMHDDRFERVERARQPKREAGLCRRVIGKPVHPTGDREILALKFGRQPIGQPDVDMRRGPKALRRQTTPATAAL